MPNVSQKDDYSDEVVTGEQEEDKLNMIEEAIANWEEVRNQQKL